VFTVPLGNLSWDKSTRVLSGEASTIGLITKIDWVPRQITVMSRQIIDFVIVQTVIDSDNDVVYWEYRSTGLDAPVVLKIFND
jgi:hypothetical protein